MIIKKTQTNFSNFFFFFWNFHQFLERILLYITEKAVGIFRAWPWCKHTCFDFSNEKVNFLNLLRHSFEHSFLFLPLLFFDALVVNSFFLLKNGGTTENGKRFISAHLSRKRLVVCDQSWYANITWEKAHRHPSLEDLHNYDWKLFNLIKDIRTVNNLLALKNT